MSTINASTGVANAAIAEIYAGGFLNHFGVNPLTYSQTAGRNCGLRQPKPQGPYYLIRAITFFYRPNTSGRKIEVTLKSEERNQPMNHHDYDGRWYAVEAEVFGSKESSENRKLIAVGSVLEPPRYWIEPVAAREAMEALNY